jgi:hypothetical protein
MAVYMAGRIIEGIYTYAYVIGKRPDLKEGIDAELILRGRADLIEV